VETSTTQLKLLKRKRKKMTKWGETKRREERKEQDKEERGKDWSKKRER
jgi:hypothetical protein